MPLSQIEIADQLSALAGADNVITDVDGMGRYLREPRKRFHVPAQAVVLPPDTAALQAIVRWANATGTALIPQGGNTGLVGAQVPKSGGEVIVSLSLFNSVRNVNAAAGNMTVEAGMSLEHVQKAAEDAGAMFPLFIASQGSATIGGVLSSNAGGIQVLAYGNARELCLGVEAVMPDGALYRGLNALRKDNTGYDLRDLLIGAEGTLGLITAATLKLVPQPDGAETAWINVASPAVAFEVFSLVRDRAGATLSAFELMPRFGVDMQLAHGMLERDPSASASPWYVMAEVSRPKGGREGVLTDALAEAFERDLVADASIAQSLDERANMWRTRENMSEVQGREGASIKHDVSVPVAAVAALIERGSVVAERLIPGIRPCPFGHMGDGNIHFNFSPPAGFDNAAFMAEAPKLHDAIYEIVLDLGGSVSAEHGIGQLKTELLKQVKDPVALEVMRKIKAVLDPNGIMNPGKMLD